MPEPSRKSELIVAGHICLDITPQFNPVQRFEQVFTPGSLSLVGAATFATGGVVANTGIAAHKLGADTVLMGKIGKDAFGSIIAERLAKSGSRLAMRVSDDVTSSYTVVLNLAGTERLFLHHAGANEMFYASDIDVHLLRETKILHFGYPPLMKSIYANHGAELAKLFSAAKKFGIATSLDTAMPDPGSESGRVDWREFLRRVGPDVDLFLPSYEELFFMLEPEKYLAWRKLGGQSDINETADIGQFREFAQCLHGFGIGIIVIKAGKSGLYLSTPDADRLQTLDSIPLKGNWNRRELWAESCRAEVIASSTGAGDCAIAAFLTALLRGRSPEDALQLAAAAGYQNLRAVDAVSGLGSWDDLGNDLNKSETRFNEMNLEPAGWTRINRGLWSLT